MFITLSHHVFHIITIVLLLLIILSTFLLILLLFKACNNDKFIGNDINSIINKINIITKIIN